MARFIAARTAGTLVDDQLSIDFGNGRTHSLTVGMVHAWRRLDVKLKPARGARGKRSAPGGALGAASSGAAKPALTPDTATYTLRPGWFPSSTPSFSTGHWVGFRPVCPSEPEKHFLEAMDPVARRVNVLGPAGAVQAVSFDAALFAGGRSVELLGPKVHGNKHALEHHLVAVHGAIELGATPELGSILAPCAAGAFDIARVRGWLSRNPQYEGVVVWAELRDGSREYFKLHRGHLGLNQDWGEALFPAGQGDPPNLIPLQ